MSFFLRIGLRMMHFSNLPIAGRDEKVAHVYHITTNNKEKRRRF
jgi:hypothetical protein